MKLYITRHGQTDGNLYRIMDGIRDIDLNQEGIKQANTTKELLKDVFRDTFQKQVANMLKMI